MLGVEVNIWEEFADSLLLCWLWVLSPSCKPQEEPGPESSADPTLCKPAEGIK